MGASINAVGNFNLFSPNNAVVGEQSQGRARLSPFERRTPDSTSQSNASSESGSGTDAGVVYQVPAGVVLQNQLQGVTGANSPAQTNAAAGTTAATTQAASSTTATGNATQSSTNDAAATTAAPSSTSPAVQSEEDQLYATLQSLGLSPAAIQQFMNTAELLAETSPGLFQAFENAVTDIIQPSQASISSAGSVSTAGETDVPATSNTSSSPDAQVEFAAVEVSGPGSAFTPASSGQGSSTSNTSPNTGIQVEFAAVEVSVPGSAVTPASSGQAGSTSTSTPAANAQAEFASVQFSETEVEITPASSGQGTVISAAVVSFSATIEPSQAAAQAPAATASSQAAAANSTTGANTNKKTSSATA